MLILDDVLAGLKVDVPYKLDAFVKVLIEYDGDSTAVSLGRELLRKLSPGSQARIQSTLSEDQPQGGHPPGGNPQQNYPQQPYQPQQPGYYQPHYQPQQSAYPGYQPGYQPQPTNYPSYPPATGNPPPNQYAGMLP